MARSKIETNLSFGEKDNYEVVGRCGFCNEELTDEWEYFKDEDGNVFCEWKCVLGFYKVKLVD